MRRGEEAEEGDWSWDGGGTAAGCGGGGTTLSTSS